jgi:hypothetical protein
MCWGSNSNGNLGIGSTTRQTSPVLVPGDYNFTSISLGGSHSCGLLSGDSLVCCGSYSAGQLGGGYIFSESLVPIELLGEKILSLGSNSFYLNKGYSGEFSVMNFGSSFYDINLPSGINNIAYVRRGKIGGDFYLNGEKLHRFLNSEYLGGVDSITSGAESVIDELIILDRALSDEEVLGLYNGSAYRANFYEIDEGVSNYTIYVKNTSSIDSYTANFSVDFSAPVVLYISPTYSNDSASKESWIFVNVSVGDESDTNVTFNLFNSSMNLINSTTSGSSSEINWTGLVEGTYYYNVTAFDAANNSAYELTRKITLDFVTPTFIWESPTPDNRSGIIESFLINLTFNDNYDLEEFVYYFDGDIENVPFISGSSSILSGTANVDIICSSAVNCNVLINQTGIVSGVLYEYNITVTDFALNSNYTETRVVRGNSAPVLNPVIYSPNSDDDVDPDSIILFNMTVSDFDYNLETVVLQIKNDTDLWNQAMDVSFENYSQTGFVYKWNSSYTFDGVSEGIYNIRVVARDILGGEDVSDEENISVYWDCTWSSTTDLGAVAGWNKNKFVGNITINNTGDSEFADGNCGLMFKLSHELTAGRVYFDDSALNQWLVYYDSSVVSAETSLVVPVNISFLGQVLQEDTTFLIEEFTSISSQENESVDISIVSNQEGPYFYSSITSAPSSVDLLENTFNLGGYLRNLMGDSIVNENNTAYNVTLEWILPTGLEISENTSLFFENISDNQLHNYISSIEFSSVKDFSPGVQKIKLRASGVNVSGAAIAGSDGAVVFEDSVEVNFVCSNITDRIYVTACGAADADYEAPVITLPGSPRGGSGGGGGASSGNLFDKSEASFELLNGEIKEFVLTIENKYSYSKENLEVTVSGENAEYVIPVPDFIKEIKPKSDYELSVKIAAPTYFNKGKYLLKFKFRGELIREDGTRQGSYSEEKFVTLYITERTRDVADEYLEKANELLVEMENSSFVVRSAKGIIEKMNESYTEVDFLKVEESFNEFQEIRNSAVEGKSLMTELKTKMDWAEKYGMNVVETRKLILLAEAVFERGDYLLARQKIDEALSMYAYETKGEIKLFYLIKNHPLESAGIFTGFLILVVLVYYFSRRFYLKRKIKSLENEGVLLLGLMEEIQKKCFNEAKMSMTEYSHSMEEYQTQLAESIKNEIKFKNKLQHFFKFKGKFKKLLSEKERFLELISELQTKYMKKGEVDARVYENLMKTYSKHLGEIEEELSFLEVKKFLNKNARRKNK